MVNCTNAYCTMSDFGGVGVVPFLNAVVQAVPVFFPLLLFMVFLVGTGTSYFVMLKTTGKKRFWNSATAMAFVTFILSIIVAAMNNSDVTYLNGYWVGFYIILTAGSWFILSNHK